MLIECVSESFASLLHYLALILISLLVFDIIVYSVFELHNDSVSNTLVSNCTFKPATPGGAGEGGLLQISSDRGDWMGCKNQNLKQSLGLPTKLILKKSLDQKWTSENSMRDLRALKISKKD